MIEKKELYKFHSIEQFHHYVSNVVSWASYHQEQLPKLKFNGVVKLHGSNSSVVFDGINLVAQSRENILNEELTNMGFLDFSKANNDFILNLMKNIKKELNLKDEKIIIYGEWAGKGISKKVALSNIEKSWFIFSIGISKNNYKENEHNVYFLNNLQVKNLLDKYLNKENKNNIYSIFDFKNYSIEIDFNNIDQAYEILDKLTQEVDKNCPVCNQLGATGYGEGIVWECSSDIERFNNTKFKSKGQSHKVVKDSKPPKYDDTELKNIKSFVDFCITEARLEQGLEYLNQKNLNIEIKNLGEFLKWVAIDCIKEEKQLLLDLKLESKKVFSHLSAKAKPWFLEKIKEDLDLKIKKIKI